MTAGNWHLYLCGTDHKIASTTQRETLQLLRDEIPVANSIFCGLAGVMESAIVSTCNRVEFYFVADKSHDPFEIVRAFYLKAKGIEIAVLQNYLQIKKDRHAADHLLRVAAGIESMVIGEDQIAGQLKDAYTSACSVKSAGKIIHRLFHQAFRVGKQVRSDTEIGRGACSISGAAMEILAPRMIQLEKPSILFIGVNQMIALSASALSVRDHGEFLFANRTKEKAVVFAAKFDSTGHSLDELPLLLERADVVITCTSSREPIINLAIFDQVFKSNPKKKLLILDLALPRDVEVGKSLNPRLEIFGLEDVKDFLSRRRQLKEEAIPEVEKIVEQRLNEFVYWFDHIRHEPLYNGLDKQFEHIRQEELSNIIERLPRDIQSEVNIATNRLINRLLQLKVRTSPDLTE
jgi:glutamyl-tRNA reductase